MKIIKGLSHCDHISAELLSYVESRFRDRQDSFFIETIRLPDGLSAGLVSALYGPIEGDLPVKEDDVRYEKRPGRDWGSRLIDREPRPTTRLTVIGGKHEDEPCVLYTVFGGPSSPREPGDPSLSGDGLAVSKAFWAEHALAQPVVAPCRFCNGDEKATACECV